MHETLLRGLQSGEVMWLAAGGNSLWPLLRDGDALKVERTSDFRVGDVAVVKLPSGVLAAHLVVSIAPLSTASTAGILDASPEGLARVIGFRRHGVERPFPRFQILGHWPALARVIKRAPMIRAVVRRLRDR